MIEFLLGLETGPPQLIDSSLDDYPMPEKVTNQNQYSVHKYI